METKPQTTNELPGQEPRPLVVVSEKSGVYSLRVTPVSALIGLRDCIDRQRGPEINFVLPTVGDIALRIGYGQNIVDIIGNFADIEMAE